MAADVSDGPKYGGQNSLVHGARLDYTGGMFGVSHDDAVRDFLRLTRVHPERPVEDLLGRLMRAFLRLPYENLTKIIRMHEEPDPEKRLRPPEIVLADHIDVGAGGTCFSLTYFFGQVLKRCGFDCYPVLCDRSYGPDTHCALIVRIGQRRVLVDPGYLMDRPLAVPVRGRSEIVTSFNRVSLARLGETAQYILATRQAGKTAIRYRLKDIPIGVELFRQKWIESFSWAQMRHLCITRLMEGGHVYLRDVHLRFATERGRSQERLAADYEGAIERAFGIDRRIVERARSCIHDHGW